MRRIRYGTKRGLDGTENGAAKDFTKEWRMENGEWRIQNGEWRLIIGVCLGVSCLSAVLGEGGLVGCWVKWYEFGGGKRPPGEAGSMVCMINYIYFMGRGKGKEESSFFINVMI